MKALPKKLFPLTLFAIAVTSLFSVQPAQAFTITLKEVGSNVVANGSGAFNVTGLTKEAGMFSTTTGIDGSAGFILTGTPGQTPFLDGYFGLTGPTNFGSGFFFPPDTGSGDFVGIFLISGARHIFVPAGYVSGTALSDSMDCIFKPVKCVRSSLHPRRGDSCQPPGKRRVTFIVAIPISRQNQWKNVLVGVIQPQRRNCLTIPLIV